MFVTDVKQMSLVLALQKGLSLLSTDYGFQCHCFLLLQVIHHSEYYLMPLPCRQQASTAGPVASSYRRARYSDPEWTARRA